jgi:hypothetical protein
MSLSSEESWDILALLHSLNFAINLLTKLQAPVSHQKIKRVDPGVGQKINGDQIQDGGHSGHIG